MPQAWEVQGEEAPHHLIENGLVNSPTKETCRAFKCQFVEEMLMVSRSNRFRSNDVEPLLLELDKP
jgi:hypothetical protein